MMSGMRPLLSFDTWRACLLVLGVAALGGAVVGGTAGCTGTDPEAANKEAASSEATSAARFSVLVFSKTDTAGFRHASIPDGRRAIQKLGRTHGFAVDTTEDAGVFTADSLSRYDAVVFLSTSGDVLNAAQQRAFEQYVQAGGGFAGIHGASATEYDWPWYGRLVGAFFDDHPEVQEATVQRVGEGHPALRSVPKQWVRTDEWYNFRTNPRDSVEVLLALDETTYEGGTMDGDHPIAWVHRPDGARAFYTGLGHTKASYTEPRFLDHLLGGIAWAAGEEVSASSDSARASS